MNRRWSSHETSKVGKNLIDDLMMLNCHVGLIVIISSILCIGYDNTFSTKSLLRFGKTLASLQWSGVGQHKRADDWTSYKRTRIRLFTLIYLEGKFERASDLDVSGNHSNCGGVQLTISSAHNSLATVGGQLKFVQMPTCSFFMLLCFTLMLFFEHFSIFPERKSSDIMAEKKYMYLLENTIF